MAEGRGARDKASKAENLKLCIVDIFGNCVPVARASEEYLSKSPDIPLFWLLLLYESGVKQLFKTNDT